MTKPLKKAGFAQGIYAQSSVAKEMVGTYRMTQDGRGFRYAYASEALAIGKMTHATQLAAAHLDEAILAAVEIGTMSLTLTVTAGTAIAENELRGGYLNINSGTGAGQNLLIAGNNAISASGTEISIALEDPIMVALDITSTFNLQRSEWWYVQLSTTDENFATGVPPISVTSGYYCWLQTHGSACVLIAGTPAVGSELILSDTEGAVAVVATSKDIDVPTIGYKTHTAGVAADYGSVFLTID